MQVDCRLRQPNYWSAPRTNSSRTKRLEVLRQMRVPTESYLRYLELVKFLVHALMTGHAVHVDNYVTYLDQAGLLGIPAVNQLVRVNGDNPETLLAIV